MTFGILLNIFVQLLLTIGGILNRLWINGALTTLLPLLVVILYLLISIASLRELGKLSNEQRIVVFGHYYQYVIELLVEFGTGIHTRNLMICIVGGYGRMAGTVVPKAENLASRVECLTKLYVAAAIFNEDTLIELKNPTIYNYSLLDVTKVKSEKKAVYVFELIDAESEPVRSKKIETKPIFVKAVECYKKQ